jgi:hypothetical protein
MRTDTHEKVLEKLATSDKATIVIERQSDGKMRVTSGPYVIFRDQFTRSERWRRPAARPAQARRWDPPIERYGPYGPGPSVSAYAGDEAIDD